MFSAGSSEDIEQLKRQLCDAVATVPTWRRCTEVAAPSFGRPLVETGLKCYSNIPDGWNTPAGSALKQAIESAELECTYFDNSYSPPGEPNVQYQGGYFTIIIGNSTRP